MEGIDPVRDPYWYDETATLYVGEAREVLAEMPTASVDCIVTAPPAWTPARDSEVEHHGIHPTPDRYVAALRRVMAEAHRVLTSEGTCWLATGDRYASSAGPGDTPSGRHARQGTDHAMTGLPISSLLGLPWQLGFALHDDGWIIRNAIVWHHPGREQEPVTDRFAIAHELILLLVKQSGYHFDLDPIRGPGPADPTVHRGQPMRFCQ